MLCQGGDKKKAGKLCFDRVYYYSGFFTSCILPSYYIRIHKLRELYRKKNYKPFYIIKNQELSFLILYYYLFLEFNFTILKNGEWSIIFIFIILSYLNYFYITGFFNWEKSYVESISIFIFFSNYFLLFFIFSSSNSCNELLINGLSLFLFLYYFDIKLFNNFGLLCVYFNYKSLSLKFTFFASSYYIFINFY